MPQPTVAHFEITSKDSLALKRFYAILFDWRLEQTPIPGYYVVNANAARIGAGIGPRRDGDAGGVNFFVEVPDVREALSDVEDLGGTVVRRPEEIPQLGITFALFADPEGHVVGLQQRR